MEQRKMADKSFYKLEKVCTRCGKKYGTDFPTSQSCFRCYQKSTMNKISNRGGLI